jgi:hypothetical protein
MTSKRPPRRESIDIRPSGTFKRVERSQNTISESDDNVLEISEVTDGYEVEYSDDAIGTAVYDDAQVIDSTTDAEGNTTSITTETVERYPTDILEVSNATLKRVSANQDNKQKAAAKIQIKATIGPTQLTNILAGETLSGNPTDQEIADELNGQYEVDGGDFGAQTVSDLRDEIEDVPLREAGSVEDIVNRPIDVTKSKEYTFVVQASGDDRESSAEYILGSQSTTVTVSSQADFEAGTLDKTEARDGTLQLGYDPSWMPSGLVSLFVFEDTGVSGSGGTVVDIADGNDATTQNGVSFISNGVFGKGAASLNDADNEYLTTPEISSTGEEFFFAWITVGSTGDYDTIFSPLDSNRDTGYFLQVTDGDKPRFGVLDISKGDAFFSAESSTTVSAGGTYFIYGEYDGASTARIVVGDVSDSGTPIDASTDYGMNALSDSSIGRDPNGTRHYGGEIHVLGVGSGSPSAESSLYLDGATGTQGEFIGTYTSEIFNLDPTKLTISSTVPANTEAKATVEVLDSNNNVTDSETFTLGGVADEEFSVSVSDVNSRVVIEETSTDETASPTVSDYELTDTAEPTTPGRAEGVVIREEDVTLGIGSGTSLRLGKPQKTVAEPLTDTRGDEREDRQAIGALGTSTQQIEPDDPDETPESPDEPAGVEVEITNATTPIPEGDTAKVTARIENTDVESKSIDAALNIDGPGYDNSEEDTTTVSVPSRDETTVELEWTTAADDGGADSETYDATVELDNGAASDTEQIVVEDQVAGTDLRVFIEEFDADIKDTETWTHSTRISNFGDTASGSTDIDLNVEWLDDPDGGSVTTIDTVSVDLAASESTTLTESDLEWAPTTGQLGDYEVTVASPDDSETVRVLVKRDDSITRGFTIDIIDTDVDDPATVGESAAVPVVITSQAVGRSSRTVTLEVRGSTRFSEIVSLDPGESITKNLTWNPNPDDEGTVIATAATSGPGADSDTVPITVNEAEDVSGDLTIDSFSVNGSEFVEGDTVTSDAQITNNTGADIDNAVTHLRIPGAGELFSQTFNIDAGETINLSEAWITEDGDAGTYTAEFETASDSATSSEFEVLTPEDAGEEEPDEPQGNFDISITGVNPSPVDQGNTVTFDIEVVNNLDEPQSGTVALTNTNAPSSDDNVGDVDSFFFGPISANTTVSYSDALAWSVPGGQTPGDYGFLAEAGQGATDSATVTVERGDPFFVIQDISGVPDFVTTSDQQFSVDVTVKNKGGAGSFDRLEAGYEPGGVCPAGGFFVTDNELNESISAGATATYSLLIGVLPDTWADVGFSSGDEIPGAVSVTTGDQRDKETFCVPVDAFDCVYDDIQDGETTSTTCDFGDDHLWEGEVDVQGGSGVGFQISAGTAGLWGLADQSDSTLQGLSIDVGSTSNAKDTPSQWLRSDGGLKNGVYEFEWRGGRDNGQTTLTITGPGGHTESIAVSSTRDPTDISISLSSSSDTLTARNMGVTNF